MFRKSARASGKENKGILGTSQAAPICQHSVLELILGGSKGHSTPLLWTTLSEPSNVDLNSFDPLLEGLNGLDVINYQADATFQAILEQSLPAAKIALAEITPYSLGYLIAFIQTTVYYYSLITNVDWSSNPLVNTGKKICNEAIENKADLDSRVAAR